ncbi:helix-turn-helix domain-containing protein [Lentzea tibetensis]|uniref:Helix-turn-helix domain-containing protein n=1 Tax=Lentzea tibetensis TaxID=2591470 RepID=A0A563EMX5_9PSEU|nr:helix-turn-helix transcriptional regulator [Lentzea tibetensis]TWP48322.1 helix-turn-helix domain-containing protein [Lentzea tibetensis]
MDRQELARFLRARRERMTPLADGRRRTPGLRREEVASLAGMSTDYYTRLEQARGPHPSASVVAGLARALELSTDERDYLFRLVDVPVPAAGPGSLRPGLRLLLSRLQSDCATVITDTGDVLAWTPLASLVFPEVEDGLNLFRLFFLSGLESRIPAPDRLDVARSHVADLRATLARRPSVRPLVDSLLESPLFARLWAEQEVAVRRSARKRIVHPVVGLLELDCEVLLSPEQDQRLVLHTAPPGSVTAARLDLLRERAVDDPAQLWVLSPGG